MRLKIGRRAALLAAALLSSAPARAQPARAVRLVVGSGPGSGVDLAARLVAQQLSVELGQSVVVENRVGAGGNIAAAAVARAEPDGATLLFATTAPVTINQFTYESLPFDPERDLLPVAFVGDSPMAFAVARDVPAASVAEFRAWAAAQPNEPHYATPGSGNIPHLVGEALRRRAGVRMSHVPYATGPQALLAATRGEVAAYVDGISTMVPGLQSGAIRVLAVTGERPVPVAPGVPLLDPAHGGRLRGWFAICAPGSLPLALAERLHAAAGRAVAAAEVTERLQRTGVYPQAMSLAELAAFVRRDRAEWGAIVREVGVRAG